MTISGFVRQKTETLLKRVNYPIILTNALSLVFVAFAQLQINHVWRIPVSATTSRYSRLLHIWTVSWDTSHPDVCSLGLVHTRKTHGKPPVDSRDHPHVTNRKTCFPASVCDASFEYFWWFVLWLLFVLWSIFCQHEIFCDYIENSITMSVYSV